MKIPRRVFLKAALPSMIGSVAAVAAYRDAKRDGVAAALQTRVITGHPDLEKNRDPGAPKITEKHIAAGARTATSDYALLIGAFSGAIGAGVGAGINRLIFPKGC